MLAASPLRSAVPMRVRGKLATPRAVLRVLAPICASSISRHLFGQDWNVVDIRCVTSGSSLCAERKMLTTGKPVN